jgi:hypothetical protein
MSSRSGLGLRARVFRCPILGSGDAAAWTTLAASWISEQSNLRPALASTEDRA